jgi:MFS family permease
MSGVMRSLQTLPRDMPREVYVLAAVAFSVAVGFGLVAPIIPVFAREFGVGRTAAAAVVSAFAFMRLVSGPGGGWLVNRLGERVVLATGIGIVAVSSLLTGLAQSYEQMLLLRGAGGVGSAMFTVSAVSLLLRTAGPRKRGRANGMFSAGFLIGGVAGPFFGGVLGDISLRIPFFVYAGTLAVAGTIAMLYLSRTTLEEPAAGNGERQRTTFRAALRRPEYRAALVTNLGSGWTLWGVRSSLIPLFVVEGLHRGPVWIGVGFLVGSAVQALSLWPAGRLTDNVGRKPAMVAGGLVASGGIGLLVVSETVVLFLAAMALYGLAAALLGTAPAAVVGDVVEGRGGTVVAAYQMAGDLGTVVGPLVAGFLADQASYSAAFAATAAILLLAVVMSLRMPETAHRSDAARPDPRLASD